MTQRVSVIGGGLAGSEAAWQLARRGVEVDLWEMRPVRSTEAHETESLAELVCSNSFRDDSMGTAVGVLKQEMRRMDSLIMRIADEVRVPAGGALAVDRVLFGQRVTEEIEALPQVTIRREEITAIPTEGIVIIATGPLTSPALSEELGKRLGTEHLYFYDAISPIITAESINMDIAFKAARYGRGGDDYINCPFDQEQYEQLVTDILAADKMPTKSFERCIYFEGCMPVEEIARRGPKTLSFGPMKPVGLEDPRTGRRAHAVLQLRQDDTAGHLFSMVGFQTKMTYPEQRRVFRTIPGLQKAEFVRLGSLHRNTYIDAPRTMAPTLAVRDAEGLYIAGQLVGVEGYVESAATGLLAGINASLQAHGQDRLELPPSTSLGALMGYISDPDRRDFQPMNANYGLFPPLPTRMRGREKKQEMGRRALADLDAWLATTGQGPTGSASAGSSQLGAKSA
ncbi:MAG: methylenetetrahydrofolate--tRNA-(uracil-5-)-methyltransferase [Hyphomicrobiaceae bacterium]